MEHIPPDHCSDSGLVAYFNSVFGRDVVQSAHVTRSLGMVFQLPKSQRHVFFSPVSARNTRLLRYHLAMIRKAKDQLEQATQQLESSGERPKAFFPDSPVHKAVTADHILMDSPVRGQILDVINRWSEAGSIRWFATGCCWYGMVC